MPDALVCFACVRVSGSFCVVSFVYRCTTTRLNKRRHDLTGVGLDDSTEGRNGSGDGLLAEKSKDPQHRKTAVVDLDQQTPLLLLVGALGGELEGIEQIERGGLAVGDVLEGRVLAGLSPLGVVRPVVVVAELGVPLQEPDKGDDLYLGGDREGVPLLGGGKIGGGVGESPEGEAPGKDKVGLDAVPDKGGHCDAAVPGEDGTERIE